MAEGLVELRKKQHRAIFTSIAKEVKDSKYSRERAEKALEAMTRYLTNRSKKDWNTDERQGKLRHFLKTHPNVGYRKWFEALSAPFNAKPKVDMVKPELAKQWVEYNFPIIKVIWDRAEEAREKGLSPTWITQADLAKRASSDDWKITVRDVRRVTERLFEDKKFHRIIRIALRTDVYNKEKVADYMTHFKKLLTNSHMLELRRALRGIDKEKAK